MQLSSDQFSTLMGRLPTPGQKIAVAVSGGADSLALCLLAHEWAVQSNRKIVVLSVDHALRAQAAKECEFVKETVTSLGMEHHTLVWEGEKPHSGIQAAARQARYDLMEKWCCANGVKDLMLGHHLNDQAETFMLRLVRGSGVDGLSAMKKVSFLSRIRLLRPLLSVPKTDLRDYLSERHISWVEDPSNKDENFDRVKMRNALEVLNAIGLTPERLAQTADVMQRVRGCLETKTQSWMDRHARSFEEGYILLNYLALGEEHEEIVLRGLTRIGMIVGGEYYPPRFERLQRLYSSLRARESATLMGCRWIVEGDSVLICREIREETVPENVYLIDIKKISEGQSLRVLGEDGWQQILAVMPALRYSSLPKPVIYALISFWDEEGVSVVPHLGYKRDDVAFEADIRFNPQNGLFS